MQVQIKKWGNSSAVRLPQAVLAQLQLAENDYFTLDIQQQTLVLRPVKKQKPKYDLHTLLSEMPDELPQVEGWEQMADEGLEKS